jgi:hypothetical protein
MPSASAVFRLIIKRKARALAENTARAAKTTKGPDCAASSCLILPETF